MEKLKNWIKENPEMTATIISAIMIVLGLALDFSGNMGAAIPTYIAAFIIGGYHSFKVAWEDLVVHRKLNVDVLMILAAAGASVIGYWMEGALLIFIFSLAESMETMALAKTTESISALMQITPEVTRYYNEAGELEEIDVADLQVGDRVQVRKGEAVPIDGTLDAEFAVLNEAAITGEPIPVNKARGDEVIGGTINEENAFDMIVSTTDENTLFAKIIRMVEEAKDAPSKTDSYIQSIEDTYVKIVLITVPLFIVLAPFVVGWSWQESFYRGMVLLTVASPCALVASASPANLSAISRSAKNGILFKGGQAVDNTSHLDAVVFDKTGTLTEGKPSIVDTFYHEPEQADTIDAIVKAAESSSTHPIAQAFIEKLVDTEDVTLDHLEDITGKGFEVTYEGATWRIGNRAFVLPEADVAHIEPNEEEQIEAFEAEGKTVIYVSRDYEFQAFYTLADQLKPDSKETIDRLHELGIKTIMLTGDEFRTASYIAEQLGIDEVQANLLPQDKAKIIEELQDKYGHVAMVGDGINDAPALATAEVGFALGSGTDVAMETADVVLIQDDLLQIPYAIGISGRTRRIVMQNIVFSLSVIVLLVIANLFQSINLPLGVIGHEGSTILVILNGLRLLRYRPES